MSLPINIALEIEQEQRAQYKLAAIEADLIRQSDLYSYGEFDGKIELEPSHPEEVSYWNGYTVGLRQHWCKKLGRELDDFEI